jgi:hypothetical protein
MSQSSWANSTGGEVMGQVTGAIEARSSLITPSDSIPERWHQSAAMTIQQTTGREFVSNVPLLAMSSHVRELIPIFGRKRKRSIGPLPTTSTCGANQFVAHSACHTKFAVPVGPVIHGYLSSKGALRCWIGAARSTVIAVDDRRGQNAKTEGKASDIGSLPRLTQKR